MKSHRKIFRFLMVLAFLFLLLVSAAATVGYKLFTSELPNIETLKDYSPRVVSRVYDAEGAILGEFFFENREVVPLERVPEVLKQAMIAAEDANFYRHEGLDFVGILRALVKNIRAGGIVQGGSTITQQVVKSLLLTPERSLQRKAKEAILAYRLERSLTKEEILYLYLNQIYLGYGAYGVQSAAQIYFGHDVSRVTLAEAALLAGLPRAPSKYSPARHPERARKRQEYVLGQMVNEGMITEEEAGEALKVKIEIQPRENLNAKTAPYLLEYVREYLLERYGEEKTFGGGLRIYTTLLKQEQLVAREAVQFGVARYNDRHPPTEGEEAEGDTIQGALLSMELPSGYVRAMVGGVDFQKSQFNRAISARRQPGSAFKPLIYSAALDKGYTPATVVVDAPIVFNDPVLKEKWKPQNYSRYFVGPTTLRDALTHSRNVITIKVLKDIGITYAFRYARKLGIESPLSPDLSMALGSSEVTLFELIRAYSVFACQGRKIEPMFILKVIDGDGNVLEENRPASEEVLSPQTAYLMTSLLTSVVREGTGRSVRSLGVPCAGKTGTTNEFKDAWFLGYTPERITGVWTGFDKPRNMGRSETGGRVAAPIWLRYMKGVLPSGASKTFPIPPGIVFAKIDTKTGLLATKGSKATRLECFVEGTEPQTVAAEEQQSEEADFFREELAPVASSGPAPESNIDGKPQIP